MKRVAFITGASRGMGLAMAQIFHERGFAVATCSTTAVANTVADLHLACNVASKNEVDATVEKVARHFGRLDVVINNAGIAGGNALDASAPDDRWHSILDVNLNGTYYVCKAAIPHLERGGRIINIASVLGLKGVADASAYVASKHAVVGLTRALAHAVGPRGITVNAICPGWVATDMGTERMADLGITIDAASRMAPLKRIVTAHEVAETAFFLASDGAGGITGQAIVVDGGMLA